MQKAEWEVIATRPAGGPLGVWTELEPMAIETNRMRVDSGYGLMAHRHTDDGMIELVVSKVPSRRQPCSVFHRDTGEGKP